MMLPRTAHELSLRGRPPRASCQLPSRRRRGSGDRPRLRARGGAAPARRDARRLISRPSYRGLAPARISRLVRLQGARGRRLPCSSLCMARSRPRSRSITCAGARRWPASDAPCACVTSPSPRCALRWRRPSPSCVCRRCPSSLRSSSLRRRCSPVWGWQRGGGSADAVDLCCWRCAHRAGDPDRCQPRWHPPFPARVAGSVGAVPSSMIGVAVFSVNGEIGPVAMLIIALLMMAAQRIWLYPACHGARDPRIPLGLVPSDGHELICRAGQLSIQKRVNCGMDKDLHLSVTLLSVGSSALPARLSVRTCSCVKRAPGQSFVLPWVSVPTSSIQR